MDFLTANVGEVKRVTRNGRDYLVAEGTLIVSDRILNGSLGPGLYPADEVESNPQSWDGMPIVVWHPTERVENEDGEEEEVHVSARDPEILDKWGVGNVYRNRAGEGKHVAQFWFDEERLLNVDARLREMGVPTVHDRLIANQPIELSTGLDPVKQPAPKGAKLSNGERYTWVARQPFNPDHVAILPDQKGACSVQDGCGVNNVSTAKNARMCWGRPCGEGEVTAAPGPAVVDSHGTKGQAISHAKDLRQRGYEAKVFEKKVVDREGREQKSYEVKHNEPRASGEVQRNNASVLRPTAVSGTTVPDPDEDDDDLEDDDDFDDIGQGGWTDAEFEAILRDAEVENALNERMCWGRPCGESSAPDERSGAAGGDSSADADIQSASKKISSLKPGRVDVIEGHKIKKDKLGSLSVDGGSPQPRGTVMRMLMEKIDKKHQATNRTLNQQTSDKGNPMKKPKFDRKKELAFVTANCACKNDKKKLQALNKSLDAMPDEALEQVANSTRVTLVVNALKAGKLKAPVVNAEGEGEAVAGVPWTKLAQLLGVEIDPRADPVGFAAELKGKLDEIAGKLGGAPAAPPPPADDDEVVASAEMDEEEEVTGNEDDEDKPVENQRKVDRPRLSEAEQERRWLATAPASIRNKFKRDKQQLVNRLLVNVSDKAKRQKLGEKLFNESTAELEERLELLGNQDRREEQSSGVNWALNSGAAVESADQQQLDDIGEMMDAPETMLSIVNAARDDERRSA